MQLELPGPNSYNTAESYYLSQSKRTQAHPRNEESRRRNASFTSNAHRFGPIPGMAAKGVADPDAPGKLHAFLW